MDLDAYFWEEEPKGSQRNRLGVLAASRALRHADIRITSQYYTDKKMRITTGLDASLSQY